MERFFYLSLTEESEVLHMHPKQALLELVERHPRLSSAQLAAMLGCSAEEVDADLQELEEKR